MASPSELSLDCKPHSYSMLLKSFGDHHHQIHLENNNNNNNQTQQQKLEDFLSRLEDERLKIDAFKRELPLCMQLLTNAVETSRQQLQAYRGNNEHLQGQQIRPVVLEEFIPIKQYSSNNSVEENQQDQKSLNISDKANWMTTAQLWCQTTTTSNVVNEGSNNKQQQPTTLTSSTTTTQETDNNNIIGFNIVSPKLNLDTKVRNGGAFLPFSKDRTSRGGSGVTDLALIGCSNETDVMEDRKKCFEGHDNNNNNGGVVNEQAGKAQIITTTEAQTTTNNTNSNNSGNGNGGGNSNNNQTHRKARRCWSPDLHRRFVNALQMLGGSQVATPKQIRELMKVDGLTNDEVKSHLQKYRLHTRRPTCPSPQAISGTPQPHQLVVLGGIWVPPEYAAAAAAAHNGGAGGPTMTTLYSAAAHHAPPHYCAPPVPNDHQFYTTTNTNSNGNNALPPLPTHQRSHHHGGQLLHHHHHQLHVYNSSSQTHSSPESDGRGNGDRSESIEDGKSESSSWKGDSGENGGERKGLAALREDGEESNGSEITLKF